MSSAAPKYPVCKRRAGEGRDPTIYPVEVKVGSPRRRRGEDFFQRLIAELLRPLIERWYVEQGDPTFVGADQFIYYEQHDPSKVVAPDVYVLPGVRPGRRIRAWKTWKTGIAPSFAIEVVSSAEPYKDYVDAPERYREFGIKELVVFDPDSHKSSDRVRWQRYRRLKRRGFVRVETSNGDRIHSRVLGCFLRVLGERDDARLRLATGPEGDVLFPTEAEAERAAKEAERAAKEEALHRVAELETLVEKRGIDLDA